MKNLIYSCVFYNKDYLNLLRLLVISYKLYGNPDENTEYLIMCNNEFEYKVCDIFKEVGMKCNIWCVDLNSIIEATYSRLMIFNYSKINEYNKILYLDTDIIISNNISNILNIELDNKLYALEEGNTSGIFWGSSLFKDVPNPRRSAFTSAILLFKNISQIKQLFTDIICHIEEHISNKIKIKFFDQPYIVYHSVINKIYDNTKLNNVCVNRNCFGKILPYNNETICHFPGQPGYYEKKMASMRNFLKNIIFIFNRNEKINMDICNFQDKKYIWNDMTIVFIKDNKIIVNDKIDGNYEIVSDLLIRCFILDSLYLIKFDNNFNSFFSLEKKNSLGVYHGVLNYNY